MRLYKLIVVALAEFFLGSFNAGQTSKEFLIKDTKTAIEFAKVIWKPYYGKLINTHKPFEASMIRDSIWVVQGTLKTKKGGKPYLEFNAYDCTVYKMSFGK
ncbi:NTF2 fold immunity protein [Fluviicola sp.]|uniref:NTF2 fold immunity protein n=1 Tax=Fluviicola sp. TaxID=1917219 RepID=UPI0026226FFF|nr:NTF2 fold immunity protein [Fluviicola sp.]